MRITPLLAGVAIAAALTLSACSAQSGTGSSASGGSAGGTSASSAAGSSSGSGDASASTKLTGSFSGLNGKKVAGSVTISGDTVTLAGFSSDEGPDLHLYLANGTTEDAVGSGTEIAPVVFDKASQTFTLPSGTDASSFTELLVHCDKAKAVFGAAALSK